MKLCCGKLVSSTKAVLKCPDALYSITIASGKAIVLKDSKGTVVNEPDQCTTINFDKLLKYLKEGFRLDEAFVMARFSNPLLEAVMAIL